jgi:hypothetical protein
MRPRLLATAAPAALVALLALGLAARPAGAQGAAGAEAWAVPGRAPAAVPGNSAVAHGSAAGIYPTRHPYPVPEALGSPACDADFCVHWVAQGFDAPDLHDTDGDGVPDYVERVLAIADHVHAVENGKLGWREPLGDGALGGSHDKTDIYLTDLAGEAVFGYTATDHGRIGTDGAARHRSAYLVLDNDYEPFEFPNTEPGRDLKVTIAHEYDHVLQYGYDAAAVERDRWFAESSAVWMEDQAYNGIDDYLRYVKSWTKLWRAPLTSDSIKEYGTAVWNQWLARHYGPAIVRDAWAAADRVRPAGSGVAAYEAAIGAAGHSSFGRDFTRFAADTAEWRTGTGFRESYLYPDLPRQGTLTLGAPPETRRLDHTTYRLLDVPARAGRAIEVDGEAPEGVAAGLALVGRIGSSRFGHTVVRFAYAGEGGTLSATLPDPSRFSRITAVLVNADAQTTSYDAAEHRWRYAGEEAPLRISGRVVR